MRKDNMKKVSLKKTILIFVSVLLLTELSTAQTSNGIIGFRRGLATVMLAGVGGAILGLSTLSFYGEPQEHIGNIWTGLAFGAIGGAAYVFSQGEQRHQINVFDSPEQRSLAPAQNLARHSDTPIFRYDWTF
jgi:hypothetical protein